MAGSVEERLAALEERMLWLEHDLRQVRSVAGILKPGRRAAESTRKHIQQPQPVLAKPGPKATASATPPRATTLPAPPAATPARDWERFFGMAVLGRIGVGAVLLAAAYFAKLAYVEMTPPLRVLSIYGLAALFVGAGFALRSRVATTYVALLWGGGTAAAYLAGVAARLRYDLVGPIPALLMLLAASALGQLLARRIRLPAIASVALAGAFAAPLLIASPTEDRTALMIYLLALHGWSAWIERVWGWSSARLVGVLGTLVVGGVWLYEFGGVDVSTYVHVELYVLGLLAPEIVRLVRRIHVARDVQGIAAFTVASAQAWLLLEAARQKAAIAQGPALVCALAAVVLLGLAIALPVHAARARNRGLTRNLARVGWIALAYAAFRFVGTLPGEGAVRSATLAVVVLGALALAALALRRRVGTGDSGALAAAILAAVVVADEAAAAHAFALLPIALVGSGALLWTARRHWIRAAAGWTGLAAVMVAIGRGHAWDAEWLVGASAGGALWLGAVFFSARRHADHALARHAAVAMAFVACHWTLLARGWTRNFADTTLWNAVFGAALLIASSAGLAAALHRTRGRRAWSLVPIGLWIVTGLVLLIAGARETSLATRDLAYPAQDALLALYLAGAAAALAAIGRWQAERVLVRVGLLLAGCTALYVFARHVRPETSAWATLAVLAPAAATVGVTWLARKSERLLAWGAVAALAVVAVAWGAHVHADRFPVEHALLNLRFLTALGVLAAAFAVQRGSAVLELRREVGGALLLGGAALAFVAGLTEVWEAVRDLDGAWPDVLVSVYATFFAAALLVAGFLRQDTRLRYAALALFGGVVVKIGLHDLATAATPLRILVTGVLGFVLLAAAFAYARRRETDAPRSAAPGTPA